MSVTQTDLDDFRRFASERLATRGANSLADLLREWEAARERVETLDSIRRGLANADAGRIRPTQDVLDELRSGLSAK